MALYVPTGRNRFCGPWVVATVGRMDTDRAAAFIGLHRKSRRRWHAPVSGVTSEVLTDALVALRLWCSRQEHYGGKRPSLAEWLLTSRLPRGHEAVVLLRGHVVVVRGTLVSDNNAKGWLPMRSYCLQFPRFAGREVMAFWAINPRRRRD